MSKGKVTHVTPVDKDHQVLSIEGGSGFRRRVCAGCPWRVENDETFPPGAFVASAPTCYDAAMNTFACHESGAEKSQVCAGFLLQNSVHNIGVRLAQSSGRIVIEEIELPDSELHNSYRDMAVANGVPEDHPALAECRADYE